MGCCLFSLIAAIAPRFALFLLWVCTDQVGIAFHDSFIWPFLGLLFIPFTTIAFSVAYHPAIGVSGWGFALIALGIILDVSNIGGGGKSILDREQ